MPHDASAEAGLAISGPPPGAGSAAASPLQGGRSSLLLATLIALVYLAAAASYPWTKPGLHYDEALFVRDTVRMLASPDRPTFGYEHRSWVRVAGRAFPIMDLPYVGAVKAYLMIVPFAVFGTSAAVERALAVLLTAAGVWGIALILVREISPCVAAVAGLVMAVHPALIDQTVYDNGVIAVWMGTLGAAAAALSRHLRRRSAGSAFLFGLAAGLAAWSRLNFLWLLGALGVSAAVCFRGLWRELRRRGASIFAGFAVGAAPLIFYEAWTRLSTLRFIGRSAERLPLTGRVAGRLPLLAETLLSDQEHRSIWGGRSLPPALVIFVAALASAGVLFAAAAPRGTHERASDAAWRRATGLSSLLFTTIMLVSRLRIAEHHLVTVVPLVAVAAVLGFRRASGPPASKALIAAAAAIFFGAALLWNFRSASAIRATGGLGMWSDAIDVVTATLRSEAPGTTASVLSWGLANNAYVLSSGAVSPIERYWGATRAFSPAGRPWTDEIARGGYFLVGEARASATAQEGFLRALAVSGARYRLWTFHDRRGNRYARLFAIERAPDGRGRTSVNPAEETGTSRPPSSRGTSASTDRRGSSG